MSRSPARSLAGRAQRLQPDAVAHHLGGPLPGVNDGTSVVRHDYAGCVAGGVLTHLEVVGNGHYWPRGSDYASGAVLGGLISDQLDAGQAVTDFFVAHGRR